MLLLPFLLGAAVAFLYTAIRVYHLFIQQEITLAYVGYGWLLAALLYGLIMWRYIIKKRYWGLGPFITFPTFQFILPFIIVLIIKNSQYGYLRALATCLTFSILYSGVFFMVFKNATFAILDRFGIKKYY